MDCTLHKKNHFPQGGKVGQLSKKKKCVFGLSILLVYGNRPRNYIWYSYAIRNFENLN